MSQLSDESLKYMEQTELSYRKKMGQYFTPKDLKDIALAKVDLFPGAMVLENSCGSGEFIQSILDKQPSVIIDGYDIDSRLVDICQQRFPNCRILQQNFLEMDHEPQYDFVIGNPPYFEYLKRDMTDNIASKFKSILKGRPNIYSLFIKASIDALKEGGKLVFVVPLSMNNGDHFSKLRDYIVESCNILDIEKFDSKKFVDAQQAVQIIVFEKLRSGEENDGNFIFQHEGIRIFTTDSEDLKERFKKGKTLKQMGFKVVTGNFVWNQNKDILSQEAADNIKLIWACNIVNNSLEWDVKKLQEKDKSKSSAAKGQYVKQIKGPHKLTRTVPVSSKSDDKTSGPKYKEVSLPQPINGRTIVVNRVTGTAGNATMRAAIVDMEGYYFVENHVNCIIATDKAEITMEQLHKLLISPSTVSMIRAITGNTQVSQKELQNLIPFALDKSNE